jgi:hypothetical protein
LALGPIDVADEDTLVSKRAIEFPAGIQARDHQIAIDLANGKHAPVSK